MKNSRYSRQILMKLERPQQIFEKYSNTKIKENLSSGNSVVPCGWTDRQRGRMIYIEREEETDREREWGKHNEAFARFSHFCERT
jgi:hypothetical protein